MFRQSRACAFLLSLLALLIPVSAGAQHAVQSPAFEAAAGDAKRLQLAPGLKLDVWAAEPQLSNSVAFAFDGKGRVYLAESDRWAISVFDITAHTNWLWQDMSFRNVTERGAFLTNQFATNLAFLTKDSEVVRRVEDRDGDGQADHTEILATGFTNAVDGTAAGVLATREGLYFANIPSLWKLDWKSAERPPSPRPSPPGRGGNAPAPEASIDKTPLTPPQSSQTAPALSSVTVSVDANAPQPASPSPGGEGRGEGGLLARSADSRHLLATGFGVHIGVSGHDLHGLIKGPDGRIYMSFGDRGCVLTNREGIVIKLPDTGGVLRCEPDGRDLEVFCYGLRNPQELAFDDFGNLWTVDNDTAGADPCRVLHLVEGGDYGWRTSYQHMDGFGPWVQEELWKGGQDGILPPAGTVSQGPSGLAFYPGTGFGERLAGTFLHCDFPGGVWAYTVKPQGASYVVDRKEKFLWNCWPTDVDFGPDGAAYVLDWVSGWGQTPRGRIYRITPQDVGADVRRLTSKSEAGSGKSEAELVAEVKRLLAEGMAQRGEKELLDLLGHADRRVRLEAQWELAERGTNSFRGLVAIANSAENQLQRIHALWAIGQLIRATDTDAFAKELNQLLSLLSGSSPEVAVQAIRVVSEGGLLNAIPEITKLLNAQTEPVKVAATLALERLYSRSIVERYHPSLLQRFAGNIPKLSHSIWATTPAINLSFPWSEFRRSLVQQETLDPVRVLAATRALEHQHYDKGQGRSWLDEAADDKDANIRLIALLTFRRQYQESVLNFLSDPDPRLIVAAGRAIHDVPIVEGFPALAAFVTKIDCPTNLMSRVINACYRLGTQQHAQMLAGFAAREDVPDWARVLALRALADWEKPSPLDRVNGLWRPLVTEAAGRSRREEAQTSPARNQAAAPEKDQSLVTSAPTNPLLERAAQAQAARNLGRAAEIPVLPADLGRSVSYDEAMALRRNPAPAQRAFLRVAGDLMNPFNLNEAGQPAGTREVLPLQIAVAEAAAKLHVKEAGTPLFEKFARTNTAPELRRAILPTLAELRSPLTGEAVKLALADPDARLRATALPYLDRLEGDSVELLVSLIAPRATVPLAQASLAALAKLPGAKADEAIRGAIAQLEAKQLPVELALDVREAARTRGLTPQRAALPELLVGGNAERGRQVFFQNQTVQCLRCHKVGTEGGIVGPDLTGIGKRQSRDYLLESILQPNAKIAAGFENVVLTLNDGSTVAGALKSEADAELAVEVTGEDGSPAVTKVAKSAVKQRERGPSAMPEGLADQLTPLELRDLVEYLATLK